MPRVAKPNPLTDPDMKALFDKLQEAQKWLPDEAIEQTAARFNMHSRHVSAMILGKKSGGVFRWNLNVVQFLLELAVERKRVFMMLLEEDFS
jgi:hypothetical protein